MDAHVRFQISFGSEGATTYLTLEWTLSGVSPVMHLKRTLARKHSMADDALVRVC